MSHTTHRGKLIAFINQNGGCGKTSLAVHAAAWLSEDKADKNVRPPNVAAMDCDPQAAAGRWLGRAAPGLQVFSPITSADVLATVQAVLPHVDFLVADSQPGLDAPALKLAELADVIVMPILPSGVNLDGTAQAIATLEAIGIFQKKPAVAVIAALNMTDPRSAQTRIARQRMADLGIATAATSIGLRTIFRAGYDRGAVVWKLPKLNAGYTAPARLARGELDALFSEILQTINGATHGWNSNSNGFGKLTAGGDGEHASQEGGADGQDDLAGERERVAA
jgi:chromosome partitioning protein